MDVTLRDAKVNGFLIEISQSKYSSAYLVSMYCMQQDEYTYGYPVSQRYYPTKEQANARFNYLKREAERGYYY